jgi:putative lipoic acid-binding regulatory protein
VRRRLSRTDPRDNLEEEAIRFEAVSKPFDVESFKQKLDATYEWPCRFTFKFVFQPAHLADFKKLYPDETWHARESEHGKYIAITLQKEVGSATEVVEVYRRAVVIPGMLAF